MKIEHTAVYVADLETACSFFTKYFGAVSGNIYRNTSTGFTSYFLSFDEGARLEIMNRPDLPAAPALSLGYSHIALSVGGKSRVDALAERLAADGYRTTSSRTTGDGYYEAVVIFENNSIEITE